MSIKLSRSCTTVAVVVCTVAQLFWPGASTLANTLMPEPATDIAFTVQGQGQHATVRVLTQALACPGISWDGRPDRPMALRARPATVPARSGGAQHENKDAVFNVSVCEAPWPANVLRAEVAGHSIPAPHAQIERVVIIADTGCRMKGSENAFQPCNDPQKWPLAQVARSAAATHPDLVIHIGDIHYRESPCPDGNQGCLNSPWGNGYDAWQADLFTPARPLLEAAPWVFVRGNHETCSRAGQGWFRFLDSQPWSEARSCNDPAQDIEADYSNPYAVPLTPETQLVVFDSAKTSGKPYASSDPAYEKYTAQMRQVARLTEQTPHSFFLSHHPLLAIAPERHGRTAQPGGTAGLQSVLAGTYPERLFPERVDVAMHGHLHFFEALGFKSAHPASLIMGNSASANEGAIPTRLPEGMEPYPGAIVDDYMARSDFGFVTLDRVASGHADQWLLTEYDVTGNPVIRCQLHGSKSHCKPVLR